jgi:hypothetical protein
MSRVYSFVLTNFMSAVSFSVQFMLIYVGSVFVSFYCSFNRIGSIIEIKIF